MLVKKPPKYSLFGLVIYLMSFTLHAGNYWEGISEAGNEHKLANVDIRFYGKVVDQHGQPIEGAKIDFYVLANNENLISDILIHGTENTRLTTKSTREIYSDGTGSFSITDLRGTSAAVEDIYKEGYFSQKGNSFSFRDVAPEALTQAT